MIFLFFVLMSFLQDRKGKNILGSHEYRIYKQRNVLLIHKYTVIQTLQ